MSIGLVMRFDDQGSLGRLDFKLLKLSDPNMRDMLEAIGSEVEAQTRTRIQDEKKAPDGTEWKDWSESYAGKQHGRTRSHQPHAGQLRASSGHTLLQLDGGLLDSIQYDVEGSNEVLIGSDLEYARKMDAERPYLGLNSQNTEDIEQLVVDFFEDLLR